MKLSNLRHFFDAVWLLPVTGLLFVLSQASLGSIFDRIGTGELLNMQVSFFHAQDYLDYFANLRERGLLDIYASHLLIDNLHPLWYGPFSLALLAVLMNRLNVHEKWNWLLALPVLAAACDVIENHIQMVFLLGPQHITDALATLTTLASDIKWTLVLVYFTAAVIWLALLALGKGKRA